MLKQVQQASSNSGQLVSTRPEELKINDQGSITVPVPQTNGEINPQSISKDRSSSASRSPKACETHAKRVTTSIYSSSVTSPPHERGRQSPSRVLSTSALLGREWEQVSYQHQVVVSGSSSLIDSYKSERLVVDCISSSSNSCQSGVPDRSSWPHARMIKRQAFAPPQRSPQASLHGSRLNLEVSETKHLGKARSPQASPQASPLGHGRPGQPDSRRGGHDDFGARLGQIPAALAYSGLAAAAASASDHIDSLSNYSRATNYQ